MLRIVAMRSDAGCAVNIGGPVFQEYKTFDVDLPALETWLREPSGTYEEREVIGVELLDDDPEAVT